jgi:hypothetical protein
MLYSYFTRVSQSMCRQCLSTRFMVVRAHGRSSTQELTWASCLFGVTCHYTLLHKVTRYILHTKISTNLTNLTLSGLNRFSNCYRSLNHGPDQWFGSPCSLNIGPDFSQVHSGSGSNHGSEPDSATTKCMAQTINKEMDIKYE